MYNKDEKSLEQRIQEFESNVKNQKPIYAYRFWKKLTSSEKDNAWSVWGEYYETCGLSDSAAIFWEMREAFKKKDMKQLKELRGQALKIREDNTFTPVPKTIDPYWFFNNQACMTYRNLMIQKDKPVIKTNETEIFN